MAQKVGPLHRNERRNKHVNMDGAEQIKAGYISSASSQHAAIAQLVERLLCRQMATGSSPVGGSQVQQHLQKPQPKSCGFCAVEFKLFMLSKLDTLAEFCYTISRV